MTLLWLFDLVEEIDWPLFETFFILFSLFSCDGDGYLPFWPERTIWGIFSPVVISVSFPWLYGSRWLSFCSLWKKKGGGDAVLKKKMFCAFENVIRGGSCPFPQILNLITGQDAWISHIKSAPYHNLIRFCLRRCLSTDSQNDFFFMRLFWLRSGKYM